MRNFKRLSVLTAIFSLVTIFTAADISAQRPVLRGSTKRTNANQNVPSGTRLRVRMDQTINSKASQVGDEFTVSVTEPVYSTDGAVVIPTGSKLTGRIDSIKKAEKGGDPGEIDVSFVNLRLPNGTERRINGSLTDLDEDDAKSDAEGTASGDKMKHRKIIFIGGGGAGGAILGAAIGGGKGALIGGLIGAGAGLLGERLTKGEEAEVKSGTEFGVYLNQGITLPRFAENRDDDYDDYDGGNTSAGGGTTYIVQPGDTLGKISTRFYGTPNGYLRIYEANRDKLSSPNNVSVGQELYIP